MLTSAGNQTVLVTPRRSRIRRVLRLEWLGQTVASLCWLASMLIYGINSTGDWLQLFAASAWLLANLAAVSGPDSGEQTN